MKEKIIATDRNNLKSLIEKEVKQYGKKCNLNHIDISKVTDMSGLLANSKFNNDISNWNVSKVTSINHLFYKSKFNGDISKWNTSKVTDMSRSFSKSKFTGDISTWRPLKVEDTTDMFLNCKAPIPYWLGGSNDKIVKKIQCYDLFNKINGDLVNKEIKIKRIKI